MGLVFTKEVDRAFNTITLAQSASFNGFLSANIIIGNPSAEDVETLFQPETNEPIIIVPDQFKWPQLLKLLGVFKSAGQARKNGWDREIPEGWSEAVFKKQRKAIFVLKVIRNE